jgi:hypothetical protein
MLNIAKFAIFQLIYAKTGHTFISFVRLVMNVKKKKKKLNCVVVEIQSPIKTTGIIFLISVKDAGKNLVTVG